MTHLPVESGLHSRFPTCHSERAAEGSEAKPALSEAKGNLVHRVETGVIHSAPEDEIPFGLAQGKPRRFGRFAAFAPQNDGGSSTEKKLSYS